MSKYGNPFMVVEDITPESEVFICCPVCGETSDQCLDHNHWFCDDCEENLEIVYRNNELVWECENCLREENEEDQGDGGYEMPCSDRDFYGDL